MSLSPAPAAGKQTTATQIYIKTCSFCQPDCSLNVGQVPAQICQLPSEPRCVPGCWGAGAEHLAGRTEVVAAFSGSMQKGRAESSQLYGCRGLPAGEEGLPMSLAACGRQGMQCPLPCQGLRCLWGDLGARSCAEGHQRSPLCHLSPACMCPGCPGIPPWPSRLSCSPLTGGAEGIIPPPRGRAPQGCRAGAGAAATQLAQAPAPALPPSAPRSHPCLSSAPNFEHLRHPAPSPSPSLEFILHIFATQHLK